MFDATTTLKQLTLSSNPVNRLTAMVGAKNFVQSEKDSWVQFMFMKTDRIKANRVRITLDPNDTYTVTFFKVYKGEMKIIKETSGLYCDDLFSHFESVTGLYLSL